MGLLGGAEEGRSGDEGVVGGGSADVLMQVQSLVTTRLLSQVRSKGLGGGDIIHSTFSRELGQANVT
jgi:hypothetical protein